MQVKANFHFHTKDDRNDKNNKIKGDIDYDLFDGILAAEKCEIKVLAVTCHNFVVTEKKYYEYAEKLGILLIPGIEKTIEKKHIVLLNVDKKAEEINTFKELEEYKKSNPNLLVLAPHPFFSLGYSLGKKLVQNIKLFDAIEYSWFHFKRFNLNKKAKKIAKKYNLPIIATSDTHNLNLLPKSYCILNLENLSWKSVKKAILDKNFENISPPQPFFSWDTWNWLPIIKKLQKIFNKKSGK